MFYSAFWERDLVIMSLVIFIPTVFAGVLLFIPRGKDELMRWVSLLGTALTLVLSLIMLIDFYRDVIDVHVFSGEGRAYAGDREKTWLSWRAEKMDRAQAVYSK